MSVELLGFVKKARRKVFYSSVRLDGVEYRSGDFVSVHPEGDFDLPHLGRISEFYVRDTDASKSVFAAVYWLYRLKLHRTLSLDPKFSDQLFSFKQAQRIDRNLPPQEA